MIPAVPFTNPPCQSIVETLGFQSPHADMSHQIFETFSAGAVLSTEVPYAAIARSFLCAGDCRSLSPRRTGPREIDEVAQALTGSGERLRRQRSSVRSKWCSAASQLYTGRSAMAKP